MSCPNCKGQLCTFNSKRVHVVENEEKNHKIDNIIKNNNKFLVPIYLIGATREVLNSYFMINSFGNY